MANTDMAQWAPAGRRGYAASSIAWRRGGGRTASALASRGAVSSILQRGLRPPPAGRVGGVSPPIALPPGSFDRSRALSPPLASAVASIVTSARPPPAARGAEASSRRRAGGDVGLIDEEDGAVDKRGARDDTGVRERRPLAAASALLGR